MKILITGCAGFIGYHVCKKLLENKKIKVYGIDNINDYYDKNLKLKRLKDLSKNKKFIFYKKDIKNYKILNNNFKKNKYDIVINLAAQAGVRYSIKNPRSYIENNIDGFFNILECSRIYKIKHLIYASTSSVYGDSNNFPLVETSNTDKPLSFYAATKKCNEVLAYSFSNIYSLKTTGLRFFTVYGPFGRPDMSLFKFTKSILNSKNIELFNNGNHERDFSYVEDIAIAIEKLIKKPAKTKVPYQIFNIASNKPYKLREFLNIIEKNTGKKFKIKKLPLQKADVIKTHGSIKKLKDYINFNPKTDLNKGVNAFLNWFYNYYKIK
tara:strand:+ start:512 stop:1483 length:972 start_codon:yes stop_codon:yes gene_type:complete